MDADGLTSTQRSKLKKKLMKESERKGMTAAVMAAAVATGDDDEEGGATAAGGAAAGGAGTAAVGGAGTADAPAATAAAGGLPPLPKPAPAATWPEVTTVLSTGRRELHVDRSKDADAAAAGGAAAADAAGAAASGAAGGGDLIDPALWHCGLLNRVEVKIPSLSVLSPLVGHLAALQTLILAGENPIERAVGRDSGSMIAATIVVPRSCGPSLWLLAVVTRMVAAIHRLLACSPPHAHLLPCRQRADGAA